MRIKSRKYMRIRKFKAVNNHKVKIIKASKYLLNNHRIFYNIVRKAYTETKHLCKYYPNYSSWYWEKVVPGVSNGTREIFIAVIEKRVAGIIICKKDDAEKKICTLFVLKGYRKRKIATLLLEKAFEYLETTRPLITIGENRIAYFSKMIEHYGWKQTQILNKDYYNNTSREIVFNGKISF